MTDQPTSYNLAAIRELLLAAFTPEDLRRFCQDRPDFKPVVRRFGPGQGLDDMVAEVITYCEKRILFGELLDEVKQANPSQYEYFEPELVGFEAGVGSHKPAADRFAKWKHDVEELGQQLGTSHPRYGAYVSLRDDLRSNIVNKTKGVRTRRRLILQALNRLALNTVRQAFGEDGLTPSASWIVTLTRNFVFVGVLGLVMALFSRPKFAEWLPCLCPWTIFFGLPVIVLSGLHIAWRWRCSPPRHLDGKIEVDLWFVRKELDIAPWIDALHLWTIPDWASNVGAVAAMVGAVLLFLLVPGPTEPTPMVESYSVRYFASGETVHLTLAEAAEQGIEIGPGDSALLTANLVDNVGVHCTWQAVQGGRLNPEPGCAARYSAPLRESDDVVGILIESECRTRECWVTVPVKIRHP